MKQFARTISLIGEDKFNILKDKTILIIGLGGVGGYALEAICRMGINNIIIVDYDTIDITNLNRQILTNQNNIGLKKVKVAEDRIKEINPNCNVITFDLKVNEDNILEIFNHKIDYVIDAIDDINAKKLIIDIAIKNKIKLISSMGMGNKFDPSKLEITDIRKTSYDKIAKVLRKYVNEKKIKDKIMVVSSKEEAIKSEIVASNSYVPAMAGLLCASYVINDIIKNTNC